MPPCMQKVMIKDKRFTVQLQIGVLLMEQYIIMKLIQQHNKVLVHVFFVMRQSCFLTHCILYMKDDSI